MTRWPVRTDQQRLLDHISIDDAGCWRWTAFLDRNGYGMFKLDRRMTSSHRASWAIHNGAIPEGLCVLHRCDVRCCVNPAHLFLGTQQENIADMARKGRKRVNTPKGDAHYYRRHPEKVRRGATHPSTKLSDDDVRAIRNSKELLRILAAKYQINQATVSQIRNRKKRSSVPD